MFTNVTAEVIKSLRKNIPRVRNAIANGTNDSKSQRANRKLCISVGIVAETFLKAKREQKSRGPQKQGEAPHRLNAKVEKTVNTYMDEILDSDDNIPEFLLCNLIHFPVESRHEIFHIFNYMNRSRRQEADGKGGQTETQFRFASLLISDDSKIMRTLIEGFGNEEIGSKVFEILAEFIRKEMVAQKILNTPELLGLFFDYMQSDRFEQASNAFDMLHTLLHKYHDISKVYLLDSYDDFVLRYNVLLKSKEYITRRQALQLMGETLIHKANRKFMMKFIGSEVQLRIILSSLFWKTATVRFEAFNIFKLFVANPRKTAEVHNLLFAEKEKLIKMLQSFHGIQRDGPNEVFDKDKRHCLKKLNKLAERDPEAEAKKEAARQAKKAAKRTES